MYPMLGFSGAKIEPVIAYRKTATDAVEQAERCKQLGHHVCPRIYHIDYDSYLMEQLFPAGEKNLPAIKELLEKHVWSRKIMIPSWKHHFHDWMIKTNSQFMIKYVETIYPSGTQVNGGCETHGDPTWANVMRNDLGEYRLIDPLPPRNEKPKLREVDLGKLLQSAIGWEEVLMKQGHRFQVTHANMNKVLRGEDDATCEKAKFWLMVHLWRLLPFAEKNGRPDIAEKAREAVFAIRL